MKKMGLKLELDRFSKTTSIKGLPRVARADSFCLRSLWLVAVVCFLMLSGYQTSILVMDYLKYDKITQISENVMNPFSSHYKESTPGINICNLNPLRSDTEAITSAGLPTFKEYLELVDNLTACHGCESNSSELMSKYASEMKSLYGYYQYLGNTNIWKAGHNITDMIVDCHIIVMDGIKRSKIKCKEDFVTIIPFLSLENFVCVHVATQGYNISNFALMGLSVVLYLDNFDEDVVDIFDAPNDIGVSQGATYTVQESGIAPMMERDARNVVPGTLTTVHLTPEVRKRLQAPYGDCVKNHENLVFVPYYNVYIKMSPLFCTSFCVDEQIIQRCNCRDVHILGIPTAKRLKHPFCGDIKLGKDKVLRNMHCSKEVRDAFLPSCLPKCKQSCSETSYITRQYQAHWPKKSHLVAFYNHYIKGRSYESNFALLRNISSTPNPFKVFSSMEIKEAHELVRENFLKINMQYQDFTHLVFIDTEKTSIEGLVSQLGGTLNLWSGITAIVFVELFECLYRILASLSSREDSKPAETTVTTVSEMVTVGTV